MSESKQEIVITGVNGFVGEHLARHLQSEGYIVHGIGREAIPRDAIAKLLDKYSQGNLMDKASVGGIDLSKASSIIHLAGLASVTDSFKFPEQYKADNSTMTNNLLLSALEQSFSGRAVIVSTGAVYDSNQPMPLNESSQKTQGSPYSIGKIAAEEIAKQYKDKGLNVVIARPFNHIGPGQAPGFLVSDLYEQILANNSNGAAIISVGNLNSRRDFTDVRDIVKAYELLATAPSLQYDTYNISSGNSYSGYDILNQLAGAMNVTVDAQVDPSRVRPTDAAEIIGDSSRIHEELHWTPLITLGQTIQDFVTSKK